MTFLCFDIGKIYQPLLSNGGGWYKTYSTRKLSDVKQLLFLSVRSITGFISSIFSLISILFWSLWLSCYTKKNKCPQSYSSDPKLSSVNSLPS